ncbi:hypothetical protein OBV_00870 [Oscillibacter valericigenes Sjm18-20]|nr:hypothetical protein OBV_00870 [Oscillibacter valericigenes Sjm18-20]
MDGKAGSSGDYLRLSAGDRGRSEGGGMQRYCRHSQLKYLGVLAERHLGYDTVFMDEAKATRAAAFADKLCNAYKDIKI